MITQALIAVFGFVLTVLGTLLVGYFKEMRKDISNMSQSMIELNTKLEVVVRDQSWHKEEIEEIKNRLKKLES